MKNSMNDIMKIFLLMLIFIFFFALQQIEAQSESNTLQNDKCYTCHKENEILPEDFHANDIHLKPGLSCAGCHGGDPTAEDKDEAMSPKKGFIGVPSKKEIPDFCGRCHSDITIMRVYRPRIETDQVKQYFTSIHGQKLLKGDKKVATCVDCHTSHQIFPVKDARSSVYALNVPNTCQKCHSNTEYMKEYGISTDQFEKYKKSIHGINLLQNNDIGSPACNDCHGNHGATPPGVESVSHVCGNCHVNNMNYFAASPMSEPFRGSEIHACEQCHGYHQVLETNDEMIGVGEKSTCTECHSEGDKGHAAAQKIYGQIKNLVVKYDSAETDLKEVQIKGMDDVDILFLLQEANQKLIHSRTLVHTFDPGKIKETTSEGMNLTDQALTMANDEIKEFHTRRRGFGVAVAFIFVLAIALFVKIKDMEKN